MLKKRQTIPHSPLRKSASHIFCLLSLHLNWEALGVGVVLKSLLMRLILFILGQPKSLTAYCDYMREWLITTYSSLVPVLPFSLVIYFFYFKLKSKASTSLLQDKHFYYLFFSSCFLFGTVT